MGFESWHAFYTSDLQGVYALLVLPALFLLFWIATGRWRARTDEGRSERFLRVYLLIFCVETLIDPIATGLLPRAVDLGAGLATGLGLLFVLLGDFRVFWLVFSLSEPERPFAASTRRALLFTPVVAISAFGLTSGFGAVFASVPDQVLWLTHELLFVAMALYLRGRVIAGATTIAPARRAALQRCASFVVVYYGLWASSDLLILAGLDAGWLLRALPNQLYYAVWIPFVYFALGRDAG